VSEVPEAGQRDGGKAGGTEASALGPAAIKIVDEHGCIFWATGADFILLSSLSA
jgi:hypothetical protein